MNAVVERREEPPAEFARWALSYCRFIESAHEYAPGARLRQCRELLARVYAASLALPRPEAIGGTSVDVVVPETPAVPKTWPGFGRFDAYWEVFDPYVEEAILAGSLSDDILDVYRDLGRGLALYERGNSLEAVWEWSFHRDVHWGAHAVDALRALDRAVRLCPGD
jgi:hypothetical protein